MAYRELKQMKAHGTNGDFANRFTVGDCGDCGDCGPRGDCGGGQGIRGGKDFSIILLITHQLFGAGLARTREGKHWI